MKRTTVIQLNDKKIFLCDLKGLQTQDILNVSQETWDMFHKEIHEGEKANFLIDITNVDLESSTLEQIATMAEQYRNNIEKEGVIGLYGIRKTIFNIYGWAIGSQLKAFETQERAMHWLAS